MHLILPLIIRIGASMQQDLAPAPTREVSYDCVSPHAWHHKGGKTGHDATPHGPDVSQKVQA